MSKEIREEILALTDPVFSPPEDLLFSAQGKITPAERLAFSDGMSKFFENFSSETDAPAKIVTIRRPEVKTCNGRSRLSAKIDVDGDVREVWFEVEEKYGKFLCFERSDAFLVALLNWAMRERCDFVCEAPVGEELLYQIRTYLIPSLVKASKTLHAPKISAEIDVKMLPNAGAVGTGISCGIDSLHAVACNAQSPFPHLRLTHLILNNVGAFFHDDKDRQFRWQTEHAKQFAREYGFEFIQTNSNLAEVFPQNHLLTHTYSSIFSVLVLQKFWGVYFYASSGYDFGAFELKNNEFNSSDHYELLSLPCFSSRQLKIYSEGGAKTRFEKTKMLADFVPAQKYLHVCTSDIGGNCNVCGKCRRTLVTLDALGKLEEFRAVFDIDYYKLHRRKYLRWLAAQQINPCGDLMVREAFKILRKEISPVLFAEASIWAVAAFVRSRAAKIPLLRKIYRKIFKRNS